MPGNTQKLLSSRLFHLLLGFAVSAVLIVWLYYSIDWSQVASQMGEIRYWALVPITFSIFFHFYLRALRWRYLIPSDTQGARPSLTKLFDSIMMGNFAAYIFPLRAGEFVRPYLLTRLSSYSFPVTFASVVIERFFDLATVLLTFAVVVPQVKGIPEWASKGAYILSIVALGIFVFIICGSFWPRQMTAACTKIFRFLPEGITKAFDKFIAELFSSARVLSNFANTVRIVVLTVLVWASCYLIFYCFFLLLPGEISILMTVTTAVIVALAVAAPSAPGFIGVYQTACIAGVQLFGQSKEYGATFSILSHVYQYIFFLLYALIFFMRYDIRLKEISHIKTPSL